MNINPFRFPHFNNILNIKFCFLLFLYFFSFKSIQAQDSKLKFEDVFIESEQKILNNQLISSQKNSLLFELDTTKYSKILSLFHRIPNLFSENKTYFLVNNESISNQMTNTEIENIFVNQKNDAIKSFIDQHSTELKFTYSDIQTLLYQSTNFKLLSGLDVNLRKDGETIMITDNKSFESIINGHFIINNCSIFFIEMLLR